MTRRYVAPTQLGRCGSRAVQFLPRGQTPSSANAQHTRTSNYSARELSGINFTSNYFAEFGETGLVSAEPLEEIRYR